MSAMQQTLAQFTDGQRPLNLNADEQTDQDVSDKLAKLITKRWSEKLVAGLALAFHQCGPSSIPHPVSYVD